MKGIVKIYLKHENRIHKTQLINQTLLITYLSNKSTAIQSALQMITNAQDGKYEDSCTPRYEYNAKIKINE